MHLPSQLLALMLQLTILSNILKIAIYLKNFFSLYCGRYKVPDHLTSCYKSSDIIFVAKYVCETSY